MPYSLQTHPPLRRYQDLFACVLDAMTSGARPAALDLEDLLTVYLKVQDHLLDLGPGWEQLHELLGVLLPAAFRSSFSGLGPEDA